MDSLSRTKKILIYALIGAVITVLYMFLKQDRALFVRISDACFAGCLVPAMVGAYFLMKKEKKASIDPFIVAGLYLAVSLIFMVIAM